MEFMHIGLTTTEKKADEIYVPATKVWVTRFMDHPFHIEWLRFEPDSPVKGPVRDLPHTAFRVDNLDQAIAGENVVLGPFNATETLRVVFILKDGAVFEFMEGSVPGHWFRGDAS